MGFLDWFHKNRKKTANTPKDSKKGVSSLSLLEILNLNGFEVSSIELESIMKNIACEIEYVRVLPEALSSEIAELTVKNSKFLMEYVQILPEAMRSQFMESTAKDSKYFVCISMHVPKDSDHLKEIKNLAVTYATISEIAGIKGLSKFIINPDDMVALEDVPSYRLHPINLLFK